MTIGNWLVHAAALLAVVAFVAAIRWARGREASARTFRLAYHGMTAALLGASGALMVAILTHDFRFDYVIGYSSRDLPLLYLISAFWAGQAGTYLLWALMAAGLGYFLFRKGAWQPAAVMACYVPTIGFLFALMLNTEGNPFSLAERVPTDGRGLNILLQDPWMASHPPMVFLGYVAATVPAVLALVAIYRKDEEGWLEPALQWTLAAFVLLGVGIILGGFWAYKVLGWGGYWGWDPVENASLVPWIILAALLHGLLVQRKAGALHRSNLALAFASYVLVLYGTFLTRSGVLADVSVHSFPAGSIYRLLVFVLLAAVGISVWALVRRRGPVGKPVPAELSWPMVLSVVVGVLFISALFVLLGTSWPIVSFSESAGGLFDSIGWGSLRESAVRPPWYNKVNLPLYVILFGLLSVGPFLAWVFHSARAVIPKLLLAVAMAAAGTGAAFALGARGMGPLILFFVALAALASNGIRFFDVARNKMLHTGAAMAHLGFSMMFVGIVASSAWGRSETALLPIGETVPVLDRQITFQGHVNGSEPRHRWQVDVQQGGTAAQAVELGMFRTESDDQIFRKPGILRRLTGDLYLAPQMLEVNDSGRSIQMERGTAVAFGEASLTFTGFDREGMKTTDEGMQVLALVEVQHGDESEIVTLPLIMAEGGQVHGHPVEVGLLPGSKLTLERIAVEQGLILVRAESPASGPSQVLTVEVSTKPFIGFLWVGTFLLPLGCVLAVARRSVESRAVAAAQDEASSAGTQVPAARVDARSRRSRARRRAAH
jgi:cytochrome c-type biogenesis protein CcmF